MGDTFRSSCICVAAAAVHLRLAALLLRLAVALLRFLLAHVLLLAGAIAGDVWKALTGGTALAWVCAFAVCVAVADYPQHIIPLALLGAFSPGWASVLLPLVCGIFQLGFGPHPLPAGVLYLLGLSLRLFYWWFAVPVAALAIWLLLGVMHDLRPPPPPQPQQPSPLVPPDRYQSFRKLGTAPLPAGCCGPVREVLLASDYYEVCCSIRSLELLELIG